MITVMITVMMMVMVMMVMMMMVMMVMMMVIMMVMMMIVMMMNDDDDDDDGDGDDDDGDGNDDGDDDGDDDDGDGDDDDDADEDDDDEIWIYIFKNWRIAKTFKPARSKLISNHHTATAAYHSPIWISTRQFVFSLVLRMKISTLTWVKRSETAHKSNSNRQIKQQKQHRQPGRRTILPWLLADVRHPDQKDPISKACPQTHQRLAAGTFLSG